MILVARFQTGDKPWGDISLPQEWRAEWRKRLKPFLGPFHLREQGDQFGPWLTRTEAIHRATVRMDHQTYPGLTVYIENKRRKGVRAHMLGANPEEAFGRVYHTTGPCRDDYPNIVIRHNAAGQIVKMQESAYLAYRMAEEMNGKPIRITGEAWRSCSQQTALYYSDPGRFAHPSESRHCRGLAMDVYNTPDNLTPQAKEALESVGFCFGVSGEPWHCAFTECA